MNVRGAYFWIFVIRKLSKNDFPAPVRPPVRLLSTWLNGAAYPTQMADWAGHSVDVLLRIYAKCVVGQDELAKRRISEALRQD